MPLETKADVGRKDSKTKILKLKEPNIGSTTGY